MTILNGLDAGLIYYPEEPPCLQGFGMRILRDPEPRPSMASRTPSARITNGSC